MKLGIQYDNAGNIKCMLGTVLANGTATSSTGSLLAPGTWKQVNIMLFERGNGYPYPAYAAFYVGSVDAQSQSFFGKKPQFASTDIVKLGGFLGKIASFKLYSPASAIISRKSFFREFDLVTA